MVNLVQQSKLREVSSEDDFKATHYNLMHWVTDLKHITAFKTPIKEF